MPVPETKRLVYKKNPLDRVICQVRFPPILKIETEVPAKFQEAIREEFPEFHEKEEGPASILQGRPLGLPIDIPRAMLPPPVKNYEFTSGDGLWRLNLTRTFMALTSLRYERRALFQAKLKGPLAILGAVYKPAHFSRIGLRYIDVIRRSKLELIGVDWRELLNPYVLGLLGSVELGGDVRSLEGKYDISLDDKSGMARIVAGLVEWEENHEQCFMIDSDFYSVGNTETSEVMNRLDGFHEQASRLIRWMVTDRLHQAMDPKEL